MTLFIHPAIEVPNELAAQYARALDNLRHHVLSHGLNRELLGSRARIYSVRINHKARLLIAPYRDEQENMSWVVLDCLSEHKYESVFLRISQHALEQQIRAMCRTQEQSSAAANESNGVVGDGQAGEEAPLPQALTFYQNKWIQLSTEQDEAVHAQLPLVINGIAGSGKTCVGESSLNQAALAATSAAPAVFVATSSKLVDKIQQSYRSTYGESDAVLFFTYQQLLARVLRDREFINDEHTAAWLSARIKTQKHLSAYVPMLSVERLCLEFRQTCIFKEKELERYLDIGSRHSSLNEEDKRWVFSAYQAYRADLIKHEQVHPDLYHDGVGVSFSFVVADESQDLSPAALSTLSSIVPSDEGKPRIMYLVDANQSLQNGNFQVLYHLQRIVGADHIITLPVSHRSPLAVIESANSILSLRNSILGGVYDKFTQSTLAKAENQIQGQMVWTERASENRYLASWAYASQTPDFAVVTQAAYQEEARIKFNTPLVFTPTQIKGLEYKEVLAYRLIEGESVRAINEKIKKGELKSSVHRARRDDSTQDNTPLAIYLNELFTTFTRALAKLFVYQETIHQNKEILALLNNIPQPSSQMTQATSLVVATEVNSTTTHASAWRVELARQQALGNQDVVNAIEQRLHQLNQKVIVQPSPLIAPFSQNESSTETRHQKLTIEQSVLSSENSSQTNLSHNADTASSVPTRDKRIVLDPLRALSAEQVIYVENFFKMITSGVKQRDKKQADELQREGDVSNLLNHKRGYMMLFVHKMKNGKCLFENLVEHNGYAHFSAYAKKSYPKYFSLLDQAIHQPDMSAKIMADILTLEWEGTHQPVLEKIKDNEKEKIVFFCSLVVTESGLKLLEGQWACFKRLFTLETFNQPLNEFGGRNFLSVFVKVPKGCELLKKKWNEIKPFITASGLNCPADNQTSALSWLVQTLEGLQLFIEKWHDIKSLLSSEGLNRQETGKGEGQSALYYLVRTQVGRHFLRKKWDEIKSFLRAAGLNKPVKAGVLYNDTPLNYFACTEEGLRLLRDRWQDIKLLLTQEGVNGVLDAQIGFIQFLGGYPQGRLILQEHWDDLKPFLTTDTFNKEIKLPPLEGQSLFFCLALELKNCSLLYERWDDIKPFLTAESLHRYTKTSQSQGANALFWLTGNLKGLRLLNEKWPDIQPYLTHESLNTPVIIHGKIIGSPLYNLIRVHGSQGYALLKQRWESIRPLLTQEGLTFSLETGLDIGKSALYWIIATCEGREFLIEKWPDLKAFITSQSMLDLIKEHPETRSLIAVAPVRSEPSAPMLRFHQPEQSKPDKGAIPARLDPNCILN